MNNEQLTEIRRLREVCKAKNDRIRVICGELETLCTLVTDTQRVFLEICISELSKIID